MNGAVVLEEPVGQLRALWEETSFQLDRLQAEPHCVAQEEGGLRERTGPTYCLPPTFPTASVPHEPGEEMCVVAWLPGHFGEEPKAWMRGLPWTRCLGRWGVEVTLWHKDTPPPRWPHPPRCHLSRRRQ